MIDELTLMPILLALSLIVALCLAYRLHVAKSRLAEQSRLIGISHLSLADMRTALDEHLLLVFTDGRGRITFSNTRFREISQYTSEELIGKDHRIVNSGYHSAEFFRELWRTISRGDIWKGEVRNRAKDGSFFWVATTIVPFLNEAGKPHQFVVISTDITVRKHIEEELHSSRLLLVQAMDATDLGAWEFNPGTGIFTWNAQFYALLGTTVEAEGGYEMAVDRFLERFCHREDRQRIRDAIASIVDAPPQATLLTIEFCILRRDTGKERDVLVRYSGVYGEAGQLLKIIGALQDISERKQIQRERESARQSAEQANRAKTAFLANMSHEIRTPLNAISGFVELLGHDPSPEDQARMLHATRESIIALTGIIDDVLDLSKIEAGKLEIRLEPVSLKAVIESTLAIFADSASSKGLYLRQRYDDRMPGVVYCDPLRLKQILFNLIGNAIKFTHRGGVELRALWQGDVDGKAYITVEIEDTGIGISHEDQLNLFQPFSQVKQDVDCEFGGTGLGLAISRRLAEMLAGSLDLQSEPGEGTVMTLALNSVIVEHGHLPAAQSTNTALLAARNVSQLQAAQATQLLIVDDNEFNRLVLSRQLALLGYRVDDSSDGKDALAKLSQTDYSLIITDCHMPGMNGFELTGNIRQRERAALTSHKTVVIAYTADAMSESRARCLQAGMNDVLIKPVSLDALGGMLELWLGADATAENRSPP